MPASVRIVDTKGFTGMCKDLAAIAGRLGATPAIRDVIVSEAKSVLEKCVSLTGPRNYFRAKRRLQSEFVALKSSFYTPQSRSGIEARKNASVSKRGFLFYYLQNHYPGVLWSELAEHVRKRALAVAAIGVSKKSWVQAADALGVALSNVPGYVRTAAPTGGARQDGFGRKLDDSKGFRVEIENRSGFLIGRLNGEQILQKAVDGRQKFFQINLEKGWLLTVQHAAGKYPGIFVKAA